MLKKDKLTPRVTHAAHTISPRSVVCKNKSKERIKAQKGKESKTRGGTLMITLVCALVHLSASIIIIRRKSYKISL